MKKSHSCWSIFIPQPDINIFVILQPASTFTLIFLHRSKPQNILVGMSKQFKLASGISNDVYVVGQNKIQVKIILTLFDSQFPLSSNPNYS